MPILEIKNLSFKYNEEKGLILNDLSFSLEKGEFVSIVGKNGCGKSTLAKLIVGLLTPTEGEIKIDSKEKNKKFVGYIFQNPDNQFVGNTVADDIAFGLENRRIPQKEMDPIIDRVLNEVDMISFKKYEPQLLSGGQKQRVAIAANLALDYQILIFDESTSMLDPNGKKEINELIKKVKKSNPELTIIQVTHSMDEVLNTDRVIALNNGTIFYDGKPHDFFKNSAVLKDLEIKSPFMYQLQDFLKSKNVDINVDDSYEEIRRKLYGN